MKILLRIDASARIEHSYTRKLADKFQSLWLEKHPGAKVINRDLAQQPIPHLSNQVIESFQAIDDHNKHSELSDQLIAELMQADQVLISSPLYNFSLPSTLKAYLDQVVRSGKTFDVTDDGYVGRLLDKKAMIITSRGSLSHPDKKDDFQTEYLQEVLKFVGITDIQNIAVEGTSLPENEKSHGLEYAERQLESFFRMPVWRGDFSSADKGEIQQLRQAQAEAIMSGDALRYSEQCTDDIQLMIPGHDIITGNKQFFLAEEAFFKNNNFDRFEKFPKTIERSGNIAVEVGKQEVVMKSVSASGKGGIFSAQQKYMHVFRLTDNGWRFSALMSNQSDG